MFYHTCKTAEGRRAKKIYVTSSCQGPGLERPDISVSHWVPAVSRSLQPMYALPAAAQLQPGAHTVLQAINVPLAPQALRFRSVSATHLAAARLPAPVKRGAGSLGSCLGLGSETQQIQHRAVPCWVRTRGQARIICHKKHYSWDYFIS